MSIGWNDRAFCQASQELTLCGPAYDHQGDVCCVEPNGGTLLKTLVGHPHPSCSHDPSSKCFEECVLECEYSPRRRQQRQLRPKIRQRRAAELPKERAAAERAAAAPVACNQEDHLPFWDCYGCELQTTKDACCRAPKAARTDGGSCLMCGWNEESGKCVSAADLDDQFFDASKRNDCLLANKVSTWHLQQELPGATRYGPRVALSGEFLAIGNPGLTVRESGKRNVGDVNLYHRQDGKTWTETQRLTGNEESDNFGRSLAMKDDILAIAVGWFTKRTHVYLRSSSGASGKFALHQVLEYDSLSVAVHDRIIAIANKDGVGVFTQGNDGLWSLSIELKPETSLSDVYESCINFDGKTLVVGASQSDVAESGRQGCAYAFIRDCDGNQVCSWSDAVKITAEDGNAGDEFGINVAVDSNTMVLSTSGTLFSYIFQQQQSGNTWKQVQKVESNQRGLPVGIKGDRMMIGSDMYVRTSVDSGPWQYEGYLGARASEAVSISDGTIAYATEFTSGAFKFIVHVYADGSASNTFKDENGSNSGNNGEGSTDDKDSAYMPTTTLNALFFLLVLFLQ